MLADALPAIALGVGWRIFCAGDRVGGGRVRVGPGGLGAEAVDDGAGGFGGCAACFGEREAVLVGQHDAGVGAGEQGHDRDGAAGFGLARPIPSSTFLIASSRLARRRARICGPMLLVTRARSSGSWPSDPW